ncbi:MAG: hypothetical protein AB7O28_26065 [Vicinamibacterales bacterium]
MIWQIAVLVGVSLLLPARVASAQVIGTFSWQMQPFCNVVTLTLTTSPAGFTLSGVDDQCGASDKASAVGVASFSGGGAVTLNFSIVTPPNGVPVHVSASVSPASGQGTWHDSAGNGGTFAFFAHAAGPARPVPPSGQVDVRFRMRGLNPAVAVPDTSIVTVNNWSSTDYIVGGGNYTAATGQYTVPVTGTYLITASVRWQPFPGIDASGSTPAMPGASRPTAIRPRRECSPSCPCPPSSF